MFVEKLFKGNKDGFEAMRNDIGGCASFNDAVQLIIKKYVPKYTWSIESVEMKQLFQLLFQSFHQK